MKTRVFFFFFCLNLAATAAAQNAADSLDAILSGLSGVERVAHLIERSQDLSRKNPAQSLALAETALNLATHLQDDLHIVRALDAIGRIHDATSSYEEAVKVYLRAIEIAEKQDFSKERAQLYSHLGIVYAILGDSDRGLTLCERAVSVAEQTDDRVILVGALGHLGLVYIMRGEYDRALTYVQRTLKENEAIDDPRGISGALSNLGIIYRNQGQYDKALEAQQRALRIRRELGEKRAIAASHGNLGLVYAGLGNYAQAMAHHREALNIRREINDRRGAASSLAYIKNVLVAQGNYREALAYYDRHIALKDSVFSEDQKQKIARLETQFAVAQKDRENEYLRRTNRIQFFVLALIISLIVVAALAFYIRRKARAAHQADLQKRNRLEAINEMIVTYNHEMNQPLTVIMGMSQILVYNAKKTGIAREEVKMIHEAGEKLTQIIHKISELKNAEDIKTKEYISGVNMVDIN